MSMSVWRTAMVVKIPVQTQLVVTSARALTKDTHYQQMENHVKVGFKPYVTVGHTHPNHLDESNLI